MISTRAGKRSLFTKELSYVRALSSDVDNQSIVGMFASGTSRHFIAMQRLVGSRGKPGIDDYRFALAAGMSP